MILGLFYGLILNDMIVYASIYPNSLPLLTSNANVDCKSCKLSQYPDYFSTNENDMKNLELDHWASGQYFLFQLLLLYYLNFPTWPHTITRKSNGYIESFTSTETIINKSSNISNNLKILKCWKWFLILCRTNPNLNMYTHYDMEQHIEMIWTELQS